LALRASPKEALFKPGLEATMSDENMGWLAGCLVVVVIVGVIIYGIGQGVAYVVTGAGNALGMVNWVEVGDIARQVLIALGVAVAVLLGTILFGFIAICLYFEHLEAQEKARREKRERERQEAIRHQKLMDRPVIPSSADQETIDGHSKLNRILRVDDETITKVWDD
jgi:hypothetical protein